MQQGTGTAAAERTSHHPFRDWLDSRLLGDHPLMREARAAILRHARGSQPVLVAGETGTGKLVAAQGIHTSGERRDRRPVTVPVPCLQESLAASALFGHRHGAFTGAQGDRRGYLVEARGSTLILDDVADLPLVVQPMLLSAVEYGAFRPVGAEADETSNARFVATSNRPLEEEVAAGRFREDLYYRLRASVVALPPLREHASDLGLYVARFLEEAVRDLGRPPLRFADGAMNVLHEHRWPGNVRELRHVVASVARDAEGDVAGPDVVAQAVGGRPAAGGDAAGVRAALEAERWNVTRAARRLGCGRTHLYKLMKRHGLSR